MTVRHSLVGLILVLIATTAASAGELRLVIRDGRVTLDAQEVSVRQILAEWARIGQTIIVNGDTLSGALVSLQLTNVPERQALDTILRAAAGYLAAPRRDGIVGASGYDRILVLASSTAVAATGVTAPPARPGNPVMPGAQIFGGARAVARPDDIEPEEDEEDEDEEPAPANDPVRPSIVTFGADQPGLVVAPPRSQTGTAETMPQDPPAGRSPSVTAPAGTQRPGVVPPARPAGRRPPQAPAQQQPDPDRF